MQSKLELSIVVASDPKLYLQLGGTWNALADIQNLYDILSQSLANNVEAVKLNSWHQIASFASCSYKSLSTAGHCCWFDQLELFAWWAWLLLPLL